MTSFKEFLKDEEVSAIEISDTIDIFIEENENPVFISIKALGEWAFNKYFTTSRIKWYRPAMLDRKNKRSFRSRPLVYDIAIACLGESEVKKRLEEIK